MTEAVEIKHAVFHRKPEGRHDETTLVIPKSGEEVTIDNNLVDLIQALWWSGVETQFCCEGYSVPEGEDETSWGYQDYRSYILMTWTDRSMELVTSLLLFFKDFARPNNTSWEIEFGHNEDFGGPRICIRFPKSRIEALTRFVKGV